MAYGGGTYSAYTKTLPGAYINFVSLSSTFAGSGDRGTVAVGLKLGWGAAQTLITITKEEFVRNALSLFGTDWSDERLRPVREIFMNADTLVYYRLNGGAKASSAVGEAMYAGTAGNKLRVTVAKSGENAFTVTTYFGAAEIDTQTVASAAGLTDNAYVVFDKTATLEESAGIAFSGGTDGEVGAEAHQQFLDKLEEASFQTLVLGSDDDALKRLYAAYTQTMREEIGVKFQTALYNFAADYEGVINVGCPAAEDPAGFVYWVAGLNAGLQANETALNTVYNGEYTMRRTYTRRELAQMLAAGMFTLHRVGSELRVLADVNSLVSYSAAKGDLFRDNRVIRVADRIAVDTAALFNDRYLGIVPNNASGRVSLWSDVVSLLGALRDSGAIEAFDSEDVTVEAGNDKNSVVISQTVTVAGSMAKLYMTCVLE
ncbi:MAG: phage tail sheath subtilisin-like domain-containing protein [Clostridia bacterium]|nr:phage tail sheath subtilisin-like domain-containing protein [Clostridia bacterium]